MAQLTIFSGRINEIQEKNLKAYPFIFFNAINSANIDYDLNKYDTEGRSKERRVTYVLQLDESANDNWDKRFKALKDAVRTLFWKDLTVRVSVNGKLAYESEKNEHLSSGKEKN
jgi:hypothetical protein